MAEESVPVTTSKPKKKKPVRTIKLTMDELERRGWIVDKCEQKLPIPAIDKRTGKPNPFANVTRDLFQMYDLIGIASVASLSEEQRLVMGRSSGSVIVGIQVTDHTSHSKRREKILNNAIHLAWKNAGGLILVHSWGKTGKRGEVKTVTLREEWL